MIYIYEWLGWHSGLNMYWSHPHYWNEVRWVRDMNIIWWKCLWTLMLTIFIAIESWCTSWLDVVTIPRSISLVPELHGAMYHTLRHSGNIMWWNCSNRLITLLEHIACIYSTFSFAVTNTKNDIWMHCRLIEEATIFIINYFN